MLKICHYLDFVPLLVGYYVCPSHQLWIKVKILLILKKNA